MDEDVKTQPAIPETRIIGIDCATQARSLGVAVGRTTSDGLLLERARAGEADFVERLVDALEGAQRAIIAIDAPLGWPRPLGDSLHGHEAGQALKPAPNDLFRRETIDSSSARSSSSRSTSAPTGSRARRMRPSPSCASCGRGSGRAFLLRNERQDILERMEDQVELCDREQLPSNADALDAAICVLAAWDFLCGRCLEPADPETAREERWIWCAARET